MWCCLPLSHMIEAFTATQLNVHFQRQSYRAFWCDEAQWRGCWRLLCYAMPLPSTTITAQSSRWNERSASLSQSCVDERKRWQWIFSLGSNGCRILQTGNKQERGSVLESKVRLPMMTDMITALSYLRRSLWMVKMIARETKHSCAASTENKFILRGGAVFMLFLPKTHRLTNTDM